MDMMTWMCVPPLSTYYTMAGAWIYACGDCGDNLMANILYVNNIRLERDAVHLHSCRSIADDPIGTSNR